MRRLRVNVVSRKGKGYYFRWVDADGRRREEFSGVGAPLGPRRRKQALDLAKDKENELIARIPTRDGAIAWEAWRNLVTVQYCSGVAEATSRQIESALNRLVELWGADPAGLRLGDVTAQVLTRHAAAMRRDGRSENTIASHFRSIRSVLAWSVEQGHLAALPAFPRVSRATGTRSRGRPLTDAEFDILKRAVPLVVEAGTADSWIDFLEGLWLSGLRLAEALKLNWQPSPDGLWIDYSDDGRPKLAIRAHAEKGQRDRLLPLTPDFAEWLDRRKGPKRGRVFRPLVRYGQPTESRDQCSHVISAIGRRSGITTEPGRHPTAHDLRRSFGLRWAMLVQPAVLQQLMRHANISTTMEFYARATADRWGDEIYASWEKRGRKVNQEVNDKRQT